MQDAVSRLMTKVKISDSGCWLFIGAVGRNGYGRFRLERRLQLAHRASYKLYKGEIPIGHHLHHVCEIRHCVNPDHLVPVLPRVHLVELSPNAPAFINSRVTHCPKGHKYTVDNLYRDKRGSRECKACKHEKWLEEAVRTGAKQRLSIADVLVIRDLSRVGVAVPFLAALYGMKQGAIRNIKIGFSWPAVTMDDLIR